jgi:hypothetical protein
MREVRIPKTAVTRFDLPPVCVATGATTGVSYQKLAFAYVPMWARLSVVFCGLIGVILILVNTQRVHAEVPFTDAAFAAYRRGKAIVAALIAAAFLPLIGGLLVAADALLIGLVLFVALLVAAAIYATVVLKNLGPTCKEIDSAHIRLAIPSEAAANAIVERLGLGPGGAAAGAAKSADDDEYDRRLQAELDRIL